MVILLDKHKRPLGFAEERRVRKFFERHRAVLYRKYPAVVILKDVDAKAFTDIKTYRIKIDPGAKYTGISVIGNEDDAVYFEMQIEHRAEQVKANLDTRRAARRSRRSRETRYRHPKFGNKKGAGNTYDSPRPDGWLPPSQRSIVDNIVHWVKKLCKWIPVTACSYEAVRFDTQLMADPDISGADYQHGTLFGYEIKEYLLTYYGHTCQYCGGASGDKVLEWEHMRPRSRGGSDKVDNATLACRTCNRDKGAQTPEEWHAKLKAGRKTKLTQARLKGIEHVLARKTTGVHTRYMAWSNATRKATEQRLFALFGDAHMECASGGRTKYNRERLGLRKDHHIDARCVGQVPEAGYKDKTGGYFLTAKAMGRGTRLLGHLNACGIIVNKFKPAAKRPFGFATGDIVEADIPKGKHQGHWIGRVMVRSSGSFDIRTETGLHTGNQRYCRRIQHNDGYQYTQNRAIPLGN